MKRSRSPSPPTTTTVIATEDTIREEEKCWKCQGHGRKRAPGGKTSKKQLALTDQICPVCHGNGKRLASQRSLELAQQPGKVIQLRGRKGHFVGPRAVQGYRLASESTDSIVNRGEILAALGCGDWRLFQLANGHKLTVDDFICAWVAAEEMRKLGYGLVQEGLFGQVLDPSENNDNAKIFHHADLGCGCGSVLMTVAWAFPQVIRSHGVEAQTVSYDLCRRGLLWNLGQDGSDPSSHHVQLSHEDLRTWKGGNLAPFDLITGTPPYFPSDRFVASENHSQKVRCRIPTRGAAADYVAAAARLIKPKGIICIVETSRKEGEEGMLQAIRDNKLKVLKRLDVITRTGLPPRFSCWVLTTTSNSSNNDKNNKNQPNENENNTNDKDKNETPDNSAASHETILNPQATDEACHFPIETLTIRNKDQSRTLQYVDAIEKMGWVDFEGTREKKLTINANQIEPS